MWLLRSEILGGTAKFFLTEADAIEYGWDLPYDYLITECPNAGFVVLTLDHYGGDDPQFFETLEAATKAVGQGHIVTIWADQPVEK